MTLEKLCEAIGLQRDVEKEVLEYSGKAEYANLLKEINQEAGKQGGEVPVQRLFEMLAPDETRIKILTYMLDRAVWAYDEYVDRGISYDIYVATMACFPRFIDECYRKTGVYAFDRGFWTGRQVSLKLFRIGTLEYEMTTHEDEPVISIHIPSDSTLSEEEITASLAHSREFFGTHYPTYSGVRYICDSWLLSPVLKEFLADTSNIIGFQNMFEIEKVKPESTSFAEWVFHVDSFEFAVVTGEDGTKETVYRKKEINLDEVPTKTSLQRKIREHLLNGGTVGDAFGYLRTGP